MSVCVIVCAISVCMCANGVNASKTTMCTVRRRKTDSIDANRRWIYIYMYVFFYSLLVTIPREKKIYFEFNVCSMCIRNGQSTNIDLFTLWQCRMRDGGENGKQRQREIWIVFHFSRRCRCTLIITKMGVKAHAHSKKLHSRPKFIALSHCSKDNNNKLSGIRWFKQRTREHSSCRMFSLIEHTINVYYRIKCSFLSFELWIEIIEFIFIYYADQWDTGSIHFANM